MSGIMSLITTVPMIIKFDINIRDPALQSAANIETHATYIIDTFLHDMSFMGFMHVCCICSIQCTWEMLKISPNSRNVHVQ